MKPSPLENSSQLSSQKRTAGIPVWTVLFAIFAGCWIIFFLLHPEYLTDVGVGHYRFVVGPDEFREIWFMDTTAILAANDAVTAGLDPYASNPLDLLRRPHVYGPAWLHLRHFGLTRENV